MACPCCGRLELDQRLLDALEELRSLAGRPVRILSGYRCLEHNARVGGRPSSRHLNGQAADLTISGLEAADIKKLAEEVPAFEGGGIGLYPEAGFVHLDVRPSRARWMRLKGRDLPLPQA